MCRFSGGRAREGLEGCRGVRGGRREKEESGDMSVLGAGFVTDLLVGPRNDTTSCKITFNKCDTLTPFLLYINIHPLIP